jgi:hypothetical protein
MMGSTQSNARLLPLLPESIEYYATRTGVVIEYPEMEERLLKYMDAFRALFFLEARYYINVFNADRSGVTWRQVGVSETREISIPLMMFERIVADGIRREVTIYDAARY